MKQRQVKTRSMREKSRIRGISRDSNLTTLKTKNMTFRGGFYLPVLTFNIDSLPETEKREITKLFWNDYFN